MNQVRILTDSNCGISQEEAEKLGISVLPMPFLIDGEEFFEGVNLSQSEFYAKLLNGASVSTSQPSIGVVEELYDKLVQGGFDVVHIPMSSSLSKTCESAMALAKNYGERVQVVDNQRISVTQKSSVLEAVALAKEGKSAKEIVAYLEETKSDSSIYIALDTLEYLKKGGRLTASAALIGSILKIKPVLQIQGGKLDSFKKVHTQKKAKEVMIAALRDDIQTRFSSLKESGKLAISVAHTNDEPAAAQFAEELKAAFPDIPLLFVDALSLSVSCHIGPNALACTVMRYKR